VAIAAREKFSVWMEHGNIVDIVQDFRSILVDVTFAPNYEHEYECKVSLLLL
jgi:hypothetical protein